jgi:O-antigen ligase
MLQGRRATLISYALMLLAGLIQLQATIQIDESKLRANAADIALALLTPVILIALYSNRARLREVAGMQFLLLAVVATLIFSFSMFRGYESISVLSTWAAIKYAGWYILLFYLALGMLITNVTGAEGNERFALGLILFQIAMIIAFLIIIFLGYKWSFNENGRLTSFSGNTNAMAFYLICGFALALTYIGRAGLTPRWQMTVLVCAAALLAGILFTKSIAALIALIIVILFSAVIHVVTLKRLLKIVVLGVSLWMMPQVISTSQAFLKNIFYKIFGILLFGTDANPFLYDRYEHTVAARIDGYLDALAMWWAHPFFGAGLGVHMHGQQLGDKPEIYILQIHNTALWLLAETGLVGFCAMAGIFVVLFHKVWSIAHSSSGKLDKEAWFQSAVLLILVGWAVMSLFHELMYQRLVWLLAGMALTAPVQPLSLWKGGGLK